MKVQTVTLNRWFVGLLAVLCFVASGVLALTSPSEVFWWGGFLRAGIVLVALWTCLPTRDRPAAWADFNPLTAAILFGVTLLAVIRPKVGLPALAIVLLVRYVFSKRRSPSVR